MMGGVLSGISLPALADPKSREVQQSKVRGEANKLQVQAVPVFPWLVVGMTSLQAVRREIGGMSGVGIISEGASAITAGQLLNLSEKPIRVESGLMGEPGLRLMSLSFSRGGSKTLEHVEWMVDRGPNLRFVEPLIDRLTTRYQDFASPIRVLDQRGDAADVYYLWDLGRYVVEAGISTGGNFVTAVFAKRSNYEMLRKANGMSDLLLPYLST